MKAAACLVVLALVAIASYAAGQVDAERDAMPEDELGVLCDRCFQELVAWADRQGLTA